MNSDVLGSKTIEKIGPEAPRIDFSSKNAIFPVFGRKYSSGILLDPHPKEKPLLGEFIRPHAPVKHQPAPQLVPKRFTNPYGLL